MPKAYWITAYRSISDQNALSAYAKLAAPALTALGGRFLVRGMPERTMEQKVLTDVTEARAKATMVQINANQLTDPAALQRFQDAQAQLSGALGRLLAVSEAYPDLKSNQNFLALQSQLEGTENRISVARRDYIQAVQAYNTDVETYPGRFWASFYAAKRMATFATSEENQRAPTVQF